MEEVHQGTEKYEQIWEGLDNVSSVLGPQEVERNSEKAQEGDPGT
jgi:hypothetical protein